VALLGAALTPFATRAQQARPVIGLINGTSAEKYEPQVAAFRQGSGETDDEIDAAARLLLDQPLIGVAQTRANQCNIGAIQ
jgi:hypothetical protein